MKQLTGFLILFAFTLTTLHAQNSSFFIGANGGVNFSKFKHTVDLAELYSTSNALTGVNGGFIAGFQIGRFTLTSGLQYVQKGSHYETDNFQDIEGTGFFSADEKLHFLSVPILLGYRKKFDSGIGVSFAMGPSFNIGLGGNIDEVTEFFGSDEIREENYTVDFGNGVNDDYRSLQMGFQLSPGLFFDINERSKLTFNVTWDIGLNDMFNPRYKQANTFFDDFEGNQFNRSTMLTIGYERHFSFGDKY